MKIHIPAFDAMAKCNEHLNHGPIDIDLGDDFIQVTRCKDCRFSYCPMTIKEGKLVQGSRRCDKARRIVEDMGFCDKGVRRDV